MASFGVFDSFLIIKTSQEWGRILYSPWKSKLKLKHMKNPRFGELHSLCQINQVCKEENQRRNLTSSNFAWLCEIFAKHAKCQKEYKLQDREQDFGEWISHPIRNFATLANLRKMNFTTSYETKAEENQFCTPMRNFTSIAKSSCVIFRYFYTDSVRFLSQDILCNYLFSPCNQLKIFLDI